MGYDAPRGGGKCAPIFLRVTTVRQDWVLENVGLDELARLAGWLSLSVAPGDVMALWGDLGAGKTTFARALIGAISHGAVKEVASPTFSLVQVYETARIDIYHFDFYRLENAADALETGLEEALGRGLCLLEWPERLGDTLAGDRLDISLEEPATLKQSDGAMAL